MIAVERSAMHCDAACVPVDQRAFLIESPLECLFDADRASHSAGS